MTDLPLRLILDADALTHNWRMLAAMSAPAACGAAVKADGYGLGARWVAGVLAAAGCRDFFVATWAEAAELAPLGLSVSVLHGVRAEDMAQALDGTARPVLNTPAQARRWREESGARACDVMVDTGMNRLGLSADDVRGGVLDGLTIDTLMSHLACADEDDTMNERQRAALASLAGATRARRLSLANSAGVALGRAYAFDLTRPGLALYGGVPCAALAGQLRQVAHPHAQVVQRRRVPAGDSVGYNATWRADTPTEIAILNIGYADGYWRGFSNRGAAMLDGRALPVRGRVSMDLIAVDVTTAPEVREGDWLPLAFDLPAAAAASGLSQYELLTGLGTRFDRQDRFGFQGS